MAVKKVGANGNQVQDSESKAEDNPKAGSKEVVALSVKGEEKGSDLIHQAGFFHGNRPVEASHLKVVGTYTSVGGARPIAASGMEVSGTLTVSGHRPIAASHLKISETYSVMGNRPVASNEIDDPATLMGYLD